MSSIARGSVVDRIVWVVLAAIPTVVIVTARRLRPDPIHGSSAQLGLAPCGFQQFTGHKCPGCGLTTAFSYMAHFDLVGAWHANAFGIPLFVSIAAFVPFALWAARRGWSVGATLAYVHAERVVIALSLLALANWLVRLFVEWPAEL